MMGPTFATSVAFDGKAPGTRLLVPACRLDLAAQCHMLIKRMLGGEGLQIFEHVRLPTEVFRPDARLARVAVDVAVDVDATSRIGVLEPGTAELGVLVVERERDSCLLE